MAAGELQMFIDPAKFDELSKLLRESPKVVLKHLAKGFGSIGRIDIERLRDSLSGGRLKVRSQGLLKSFKAKSTDQSLATAVNKLFVDEYTRWPAAKIFETGGTISGKGKQLTILTPAARGASGRRKWTQAMIRQAIADGRLKIIPTPRGALIVDESKIGKRTKSGGLRKNSRVEIIAILKRSVQQEKRLDFYENFAANESLHNSILENALADAVDEIEQSK